MKNITPQKAYWLFIVLFLTGSAVGLMAATYDSPAAVAVGIVLMVVGMVIHIMFYRCPECGRYLGRSRGEFCPYCGKKLSK